MKKMRKKYLALLLIAQSVFLYGCTIPFNQEPDSPDSGEEVAIDPEPDSPDSGEEVAIDPEPDSPDSGEEVAIDPEPDSPDSGEEIIVKNDSGNIKASCNIIAVGSTCAEYIGSYWAKDGTAALSCDSQGVFSKNPCPRPTIGGCRMGAGTANELITWHYNYGGSPYTDEVRPYAISACNALSNADWVN